MGSSNELSALEKQDFSFVFSFAGEDREIVEKIVTYLEGKKCLIFYDYNYEVELVGTDLYSFLRNIYKSQGKYVVCFISKHYKEKIWTNVEWSAIKERLMTTLFSDCVIPILLDDETHLTDIPSFIGLYKHKTIEDTGEFLYKKYNTSLIEDNYKHNISYCISFIIENIIEKLSLCQIDAHKDDNKIVIIKNSTQTEIELVAESLFNIRSLLLYRSDKFPNAPIMHISWTYSIENIMFTVHILEQLASHQENLHLMELITYLASYIQTEV